MKRVENMLLLTKSYITEFKLVDFVKEHIKVKCYHG